MTTSSPENQVNSYDGMSEEYIVVKQLELSSESLIRDILNDVFSESDSSEKGSVYTLHLKDFDSGIKASIVKEHNDRIDRLKFNDCIGYVILEKDTIIVTGKNLPDFRYSKDSQPLRFPLLEFLRNDSPEWQYLINDRVFARYGESMGWIWHIPNENLKDYNLTKYTITAPARTKK